jgi:hypothetical protein
MITFMIAFTPLLGMSEAVSAFLLDRKTEVNCAT